MNKADEQAVEAYLELLRAKVDFYLEFIERRTVQQFLDICARYPRRRRKFMERLDRWIGK